MTRVHLAGIYATHFHKRGAVYARLNPVERQHRDGVEHVLENFADMTPGVVEELRSDGAHIFLDSGAFPAFTRGVRIDLGEYVRFIERHADLIAEDEGQPLYAVLDAIGDPEKTWANQQAMEALGARPLPCFHYGEPESYLRRYLDRYPYIALGGMVPVPRPRLELWLHRIWTRYLKGSGVKVHGFGLTREEFILRWPWRSVDSTSWLHRSKNRTVYVPRVGGCETRRLSTGALRVVRQRGFDPARLDADYGVRWAFNAWAYTAMASPTR